MPKKLGTNPKAAEARERKQLKKETANEKVKKNAEEALWADDDKQLQKKQNRKDEAERKKAEALRKKQESKQLLEQEMSSIKSAKVQPQKITQAQIKEDIEKKANLQQEPTPSRKISEPETDYGIPENENRKDIDTISASGIDEALAALSTSNEDTDKHPEKRMKAAYRAFVAANMSRIKSENPSLKLSQWQQILFKEWQKSDQNPINIKREKLAGMQ